MPAGIGRYGKARRNRQIGPVHDLAQVGGFSSHGVAVFETQALQGQHQTCFFQGLPAHQIAQDLDADPFRDIEQLGEFGFPQRIEILNDGKDLRD